MTSERDIASLGDDELLALLGEALRTADPVPPHIAAGARAAWTWRTIDTELAEIVFDSEMELSGVRAETTHRQVTFQAPGVEIEVMVIDEDQRRLVGQLIPPGERRINIVVGDDVETMSSDRLGRFTCDSLSPGPVRLVVLGDQGEPLVQTEWVIL